MTPATGKIYVVDDDPAVCESLEALLASIGFEVEAYQSGTAFLARFDPSDTACVLLDVRMPETDGLAVLEKLGAPARGFPVIMVTAHGDVPMAVRAMQAGAADFIEKPFEPDELLESIERSITRAQPEPVTADASLRAVFDQLTPRETDVMRQMVIGHPNKIIAHNLGLSPRTVEIHRGRVMQKTAAESLSHLVRMAIKAGYDPDGAET